MLTSRDILGIQLNIHVTPFLPKYSTAKSCELFTQKSFIGDIQLRSKYVSISYLTELLKMCISTKEMVSGIAHKKQTKKNITNNKQTCLPIKSNLIVVVNDTARIMEKLFFS